MQQLGHESEPILYACTCQLSNHAGVSLRVREGLLCVAWFPRLVSQQTARQEDLGSCVDWHGGVHTQGVLGLGPNDWPIVIILRALSSWERTM